MSLVIGVSDLAVRVAEEINNLRGGQKSLLAGEGQWRIQRNLWRTQRNDNAGPASPVPPSWAGIAIPAGRIITGLNLYGRATRNIDIDIAATVDDSLVFADTFSAATQLVFNTFRFTFTVPQSGGLYLYMRGGNNWVNARYDGSYTFEVL